MSTAIEHIVSVLVALGNRRQLEDMKLYGQEPRYRLLACREEAAIKIDTFDFTRYGLLHGQVTSLSRDAIIKDDPQSKENARVISGSGGDSEPKGQEGT